MAKKKRKQPNWGKWILIGIGVLFIGSILWSMWFETLLPLIRSGDTAAVVNNVLGLPIILLATAVIVYGGFLVVRATLTTMGDAQLVQNIAIIRAREDKTAVRRAQRQNMMALFRAWRHGSALMLLGFGLMALGGWLINL